MKFIFISVFCFLFANEIIAQQNPDSIEPAKKSTRPKIHFVMAVNTIAYGGTMVSLYETWYKNYPQSSFHFFNDNKEWLQVDKAGHAWSAYSEGRATMALWKWAGLPNKKAIWVGGLSGLAYQSIIEVLDGFSSEWGFSWGDYLANIGGSSVLIAEQLAWNEQRIQLKFSTHRENYPTKELTQRANEIYGKSLPERFLKDYNAQTYWASVNLRSFFRQSNLPKWFNISFGYGANGMFGALNNRWNSSDGVQHDRTDIKRYRQIYLSPDIDLTKIKTKSKLIKATFFVLNSLKFPMPSLELSGREMKWHGGFF